MICHLVAGFGSISHTHENPSPILIKAENQIVVPTKYCNDINKIIYNHQICVRNKDAHPCHGDAGGPLIVQVGAEK